MIRRRTVPLALIAAALGTACASAPAARSSTGLPPLPASAPPPVEVRTSPEAIAAARADSVKKPYVEADVKFMTNMIGHHAQAIEMARYAPGNGASPAVQRLAERIINAQLDEIVLMQQWLMDRQKPVPAVHAHGTTGHTDADHARHVAGGGMSGAGHDMHQLMPGMLSEQEMATLKAARGREFDRLFLTYMIRHHQGAVTMVTELFGTYGAGQNDSVFKLASDVNVDQTTEIARMEQMLATMQP